MRPSPITSLAWQLARIRFAPALPERRDCAFPKGSTDQRQGGAPASSLSGLTDDSDIR